MQEAGAHTQALLRRARIAPASLAAPDVLHLQRTVGNRAVQRLLAGAPGRGLASPARPGPVVDAAALHHPASGFAREAIQRAVGFEIEMDILADENGQDAQEKVTHYENGGLTLTIDHGGTELLDLTKAIEKREKERSPTKTSPTGAYHSILEIVTPPAEIEKPADKRKALQYIRRAQKMAVQIVEGTDGLRRRVPLANIFPEASSLFVGADVGRLGLPQRQTTDAHIQASVGVDLAQVPELLSLLPRMRYSQVPKGQALSVESDVQASVQYEAILAKSRAVAGTIIHEIREAMRGNGASKELRAGQNLVNLKGLLATMALYLLGGGDALLLDSNWKNFTPLLSRVDLGTLFKTSLTPTERAIFAESDNTDHIKDRLLSETGRLGMMPLIAKPVYKKWSITCEAFIDNVLAGQPDGIMTLLTSMEKFKELQPESVGPARQPEQLTESSTSQYPVDARRQGIVFETRVMKYRKPMLDKIDELIASGGKTRYPLESWYPVAEEVIDLVMQLNRSRDVFEEELDEAEAIQFQQEYREYMSQRNDEI